MRLIAFSSWPSRTLLSLIIGSPCALCLAQQPTTTTLYLPNAHPATNDQVGLTAIITPTAAGDPSSNGVKFTWSLPNQAPQSTIAYPSGGEADVGIGPLPAGTYAVQAFYLGLTSATPGGASYKPSQSAAASFTVVPYGTLESMMTGQYAFLFQGTSTAGGTTSASAAAGSFTADGQGNITAGVLDLLTSASGYVHSSSVTGAYALDTSGNGTLTLITPEFGSQTMLISTHPFQTQGAISQHFAAILSGGPLLGSMQIERQSAADFSYSALAGSYRLQLAGVRAGNPPLLIAGSGSLVMLADGYVSGYLNETIGTSTYLGIGSRGGSPLPPAPTTGVFELELIPYNDNPVCAVSSALYNIYTIDATHLFLINKLPYPGCPYDVLSGTATQ